MQIPNSAFVNGPATPPPPPTAGSLRYRYYTFTGTWYNMPNLHSLTPVATGTVPTITLANRTQNDRFAYLWESNINIPVSGTYTFRTTSDDGSQFWIGSLPGPLINNDGLHGPQDMDGTISLNAGNYPIAVLYFEQDGGETMNLSWKTPQTGNNFISIPNAAFVSSTPNAVTAKYISDYNNSMNIATTKKMSADGYEQALSIFPNPAPEQVTLRINDTEMGKIQVKLINAEGKVMRTNTYQKQNIAWQQQIPVAHLKAGYYILQVRGRKLNYSRSFIKK